MALKANTSDSGKTEEEVVLTKRQKKRRRRQAASNVQKNLSNIPCAFTPSWEGAVNTIVEIVVPGHQGKRTQVDRSSDPIQGARPQPKRRCEATSGARHLKFFMVIRKDNNGNDFSDNERSTLEDHINKVLISDTRSTRGLQ